ncbi:DEAD/DEAH box helicase [Dictyobacter arantiisoli]|uniref:RNA helicase n=1 Tax=Dictyobacter arantiisoli TaxID=2014874 RepID=A0A5A5TIP3_9CHLR|nr:DEAD/DEAH box helicase [Dictyobacter arantiisoli]GCF11078.1 RNA helicase [Dictyobacter arantiisoli]
MNIFELRNTIIDDYSAYIKSFIKIRDTKIHNFIEHELFKGGALWPEPLIQLNPLFAQGESIDGLITEKILHPDCAHIFRRNKSDEQPNGEPLFLHKHQEEAIRIANGGHSYVLTTGTGSGKSLAYIIPIVNYVLQHPEQRGIKAIVVYPMNALANSQKNELDKYLQGLFAGKVRSARYTGQESKAEREAIIADPPDILLTNYVMLELILTRPRERDLIASTNLRFLVLDELHTYRGRQGADVALLVRRVRDRLTEPDQPLQYVGTSATLAGGDSYVEQRREVAAMASRLFGTTVSPEHVISETLVRTTSTVDEESPAFLDQLRERVANAADKHPQTYTDFIHDPLSTWLESTFGITTREERLVRTRPLRITGGDTSAAVRLSSLTGVPVERCSKIIEDGLLAGYEQVQHPQTGRSPFAFRLHQFISKGDMVYASLEAASQRHLTIHYQQFVPGTERSQILLPLVFCRECGQEYYCVRKKNDALLSKRELNDRTNEELEGKPGYLYLSADKPWPRTSEEIDGWLPEDWKEERANGRMALAHTKKDLRPLPIRVRADGEIVGPEEEGTDGHFLRAPFRLCLSCGVEYDSTQDNDFAKLSSLSSEGRSTSTTILSLSAIRHVNEARHAGDLLGVAPKLLSFTDNRQDASLQAGHFNDYIEIGLLRSALYQAVKQAGEEGLSHDTLTMKVFETLHLPMAHYAVDDKVKYAALAETNKAFRNVLGYRLYRDLKRGWRITSPNLEQSGLLVIDYLSLAEVCEDEEIWQNMHPALQQASPATRREISKTLLDYMRRELVIKVDYLNKDYQDALQQQSNQRLIAPWALDEQEQKEYAPILIPRSKGQFDDGSHRYLSGRSGFGRYLRRKTTFKDYAPTLSTTEAGTLIVQLLDGLRNAGLVEVVLEPDEKHGIAGYQLPASALIWREGNGEVALHDPIRVPHPPDTERAVNTFFRKFYQEKAEYLLGIEAREHTAQVTNEERMKREDDFRKNILPILYCSPTMELGVDIAELNLVNMRNIPPTPANYAQRSGRAGRSGQPALVFSYCSTGSSHDQYFFRHPEEMVQGAVSPPRLDLMNEDLVRAHVYAIWLAETNLSLEGSLKDLLDVAGQTPSLQLLPDVKHELERLDARERAEEHAQRVLKTLVQEADETAEWLRSTNWLATTLNAVENRFNDACTRWRRLYETALEQFDQQTQIIRDSSKSKNEKETAERLRQEATSQLSLLTNDGSLDQSDFYSYRYMASEGFLPGYNFPRLPLAAYIPARRKKQKDEYLSRPRFLAISEFAPNAIIYHEGSRYVINRALLSVTEDGSAVLTRTVKQCTHCGYLHWQSDEKLIDLCEYCHTRLEAPLSGLFRLQSVSTKRRDRISSDEEERQRQGYNVRTAVRFASFVEASLDGPYGQLGKVTYGQSATLSRINFGPLRRKSDVKGFLLDTQRGYWRSEQDAASDQSKPGSQPYTRVIPYVEDTRNCLLFEPDPALKLHEQQMASLQSALKSAIQLHYQLEDNELAAEPLPNSKERHFILFYESSEGGAGVLRQLVDDPTALQQVAREALLLCHYDPTTGENLRRAEGAAEDCEAACYNCLMTYANQRDHLLLDRASIRDILLELCQTTVNFRSMSTSSSHEQPVVELIARSEVEQAWLQFLHEQGYQFTPSELAAPAQAHPDFYHAQTRAAIYIDGDVERYPERQQRDEEVLEDLIDEGYMIVRFGAPHTWEAQIAKNPNIFRRIQ